MAKDDEMDFFQVMRTMRALGVDSECQLLIKCGRWITPIVGVESPDGHIAYIVGHMDGPPPDNANAVMADPTAPAPTWDYRRMFSLMQEIEHEVAEMIRHQGDLKDINERGALATQTRETQKALEVLAGLMELWRLGERR